MTDQMIKDALSSVADRAEPVDDLADRALRAATRRRRKRAVTGAAALALAVVLPVTVVAEGERSTTGVLGPSGGNGSGLPKNTPEEEALARACMRNGPPVGSKGETRPGKGSATDFRVLTKLRVRVGQLVEVGNRRGYVLCVSDGMGNTEPPRLNVWPGKSPGGLFGFDAPLRVDGIQQVQALSIWDELHAVVVGRAKPGVVEVRVTWAGGRTGEAAVQNGFFLAQTPIRAVPDNGVKGPMSRGAMSSPTMRVLSVTGYDAAGRVLHTWRPKVETEETGFTPADCTDGLTRPRPTLCD